MNCVCLIVTNRYIDVESLLNLVQGNDERGGRMTIGWIEVKHDLRYLCSMLDYAINCLVFWHLLLTVCRWSIISVIWTWPLLIILWGLSPRILKGMVRSFNFCHFVLLFGILLLSWFFYLKVQHSNTFLFFLISWWWWLGEYILFCKWS